MSVRRLIGKWEVPWGAPRLGNLALEAPRLEMSVCSKESKRKMVGSRGVPRLGNLALEAPRLEMNVCSKESMRKMGGSVGCAQIGKSSPGAPQDGNEKI